jgi:hypothetical protein
MRPLSVSADRSRYSRHGWSGKLPRPIHSCQKSPVRERRVCASAKLCGGVESPHDSAQNAWIALEGEIYRAVQASDRAEQHMLGAVVRRCALVQGRPVGLMAPRPHQQDVANHRPARRGRPRRLQDHRPRQVTPPGRYQDVRGSKPERAGAPVQDRTEDARPVHPGQAHPLDAAARPDQGAHLAVGQEPVIGGRRERASPGVGWAAGAGKSAGTYGWSLLVRS